MDDDFITAIEQHKRSVRYLRRSICELPRAAKYVGESVVLGLDWQTSGFAGRDGDIEILRRGSDALYRPGFSQEASADNPDARSVIVRDFRNVVRLDVLI